MGLFNTFGAVSGQMSARQERLQVADALIEEFKVPGKLAGLLASFKQSAYGQMLQHWLAGQTDAVSPSQIQEGLGQSTLLQDLATRTRMPVGIVKTHLAVLMPLSIAQLGRDGYVTADGEASAKPLMEGESLADTLRG